MDEEKKEEEVKEEEVKTKKKKEKKEGSGNGISVGLQFLTLLVMIAMVLLQYVQFQKIEDVEKRLGEDGKLASTMEKEKISMNDIVMYQVVEAGTYNVKDGTTDRYLKMTVNLGLDSTDKNYKSDYEPFIAKPTVIQEVVEQIVCSTEMSYFDGADKEYTVKQKIIDQLNQTFDTTIVYSVYFSDKIKA